MCVCGCGGGGGGGGRKVKGLYVSEEEGVVKQQYIVLTYQSTY